MNRLESEWQRLYGVAGPGADDHSSGLINAAGQVRALVLELARPADWEPLSRVWLAVQHELGLPAPGVAVSGVDACQLWFSLAEPVAPDLAQRFLEALRRRHLGEIDRQRIRCWPTVEGAEARPEPKVPALQEATGHWSAFVTPDLAPMFAEDPWLDLPPSPEAQADLLSRLDCAEAPSFQRALERLDAASPPKGTTEIRPMQPAGAAGGERPRSPTDFLLGVMNDPAVALALRIEAAKALLPYINR